jgi:hypothetical protein
MGPTVPLPQLIVAGTGWPTGAATYSIEVQLICHFECLAGLTQGGNDIDDGELPVDPLTIDQAARAAANAGDPVLTSQIIADSIDSFAANIDRFARFGRGPAHVFRNALGMQNNAPLPTNGVDAGPSSF